MEVKSIKKKFECLKRDIRKLKDEWYFKGRADGKQDLWDDICEGNKDSETQDVEYIIVDLERVRKLKKIHNLK